MTDELNNPHLQMGQGFEFDAIRQFIAQWGNTARGIGDDAAMLSAPSGSTIVVSTDATVENVHFKRAWISATEVGERAARAALSDLAAMGAAASSILISFIVPHSWRHDLNEVAAGVANVARLFNAQIVGGNISSGDTFSCTLTVIGHASRPVSRGGGQSDDILLVTGNLGAPQAAVAAWERGEQPVAQHRHRFVSPTPRLREGLWLGSHGAHAMIDISDGLTADAEHLARASGLVSDIDVEQVPRASHVTAQEAATGGEEYELLVALSPDRVKPLQAEFEAEFGVPLTAVGVLRQPETENIAGVRVEFPKGHDHFSR